MDASIIPYDSHLKKYAQALRKRGTLGEVVLWLHLKKKQMKGYDFHRQKPLVHYIVDFYCPELKLAIEIDGYSHHEKWDLDQKRQSELEGLGIHFLRFTEQEVRKNLEGVLIVIESWVNERVG